MSTASLSITSRGTFAVVNLRAIAHNVRAFRAHVVPDAKLLIAVKANGYGHGAVEVAEVALQNGADVLGVASLNEAIELREAGMDAPILVFGQVSAPALPIAAAHRVSVTLTADWSQWGIPECVPPLPVHIKVDTGMGRLGFREADDVLQAAEYVRRRPDMDIQGIYSHLACADDMTSNHAAEQVAQFRAVTSQLESVGIAAGSRHIANSAGTLRDKSWHLDMVRVGISAYGLSPSSDFALPIDLRQALHLYAVVQRVAWLEPGDTVGYGATFRASRRTRIATLPVGYADGIHRALSNQGHVLLKGQRAPIVGRVCMDQLMVDVTDIPGVGVGDCATLYGRSAPAAWDGGALQRDVNEADILTAFAAAGDTDDARSPATDGSNRTLLSLTEVADAAGTISYELACALGQRVPRLYLWPEG